MIFCGEFKTTICVIIIISIPFQLALEITAFDVIVFLAFLKILLFRI